MTDDDRAPARLRTRVAGELSRTRQRPRWRARLSVWTADVGLGRPLLLASTMVAAVVLTVVAIGLVGRPRDVGRPTASPSASPSSTTPAIGADLPVGAFRPSAFQPPFTLHLDAPWKLAVDDLDSVQLESELDGDLVAVSIHRPRGVADPDSEQPLALPTDLAAWIETHPALEVVERSDVELGGMPAIRFRARSLYEEGPQTGASLEFLLHERSSVNLEPGIAYEIWVARLDGQPIVALGGTPERRATELAELVDGLLASLRFEAT